MSCAERSSRSGARCATSRRATTSPRRATSRVASASTAGPARRTCASRRRSSASIATAGSPTTSRSRLPSSGGTTARSSRPRSRACRSRSGTPSSRPRRRISRAAPSPCSAAVRSASSRSRSPRRSDRAGSWPPITCRSGCELARTLGADAVVNVDEVDDVPAWFVEQNEGVGVGVVFEMSGALRAIQDAFDIVRHGGQHRPLRNSGAARDDRHRRVAHLQEPHRHRRQRPRDLGDVVHDALAPRARRRRPPPAHHRASCRSSATTRRSRSSSRVRPARSSCDRTERPRDHDCSTSSSARSSTRCATPARTSAS